MAVYGYVRVSTDRQADEGDSLEVQRRQLAGWALMQGEEISEIMEDRGVSGSVPLQDRPEGARLLKHLRAGDTLVAPKLDRLFRSALDALQTIEAMRSKKVKVWLLDLGDVTGNGMAKAFMTMAAAFAELERDRIRERVNDSKRNQREQGRYLGGHVPFGFAVRAETINGRTEKVLTLVEVEQNIIAEARRLRGEGVRFREMQSLIEEQHGRRIALATLSRICREEDPAA